MKKTTPPTRRKLLCGFCGIATIPLLSSCGTILYPARVNQKERGDLDFIVVGLDAVGLLFFLIPGIVAFAVDFGTGAIYFPEDHEKGDRETTIFDKMDSQVQSGEQLRQQDIERMVSDRVGAGIDLARDDVRVMRLDHIGQFHKAYAQLSA